MSALAPITLFVHDRPDRTATILDALGRSELAARSRLTIFCDGPKSSDEAEDVEHVRRIARSAEGFEQIDIVEYADHRGRSHLLVDGVTRIVNDYGKVIVVEDDLLVSPYFLRFMNDGLDRYARNEEVISVCGYAYALNTEVAETYFIPGAHCWGWATWQRGWELLRQDPAVLVDELVERELVYAFDGGGAEPLTQVLQETDIENEFSWSLCWMAVATLSGKLTLYPRRSLVVNVDMSMPESNVAPVFKSKLADRPIDVCDVPVKPNEAVLCELTSSLIEWRCNGNYKIRMYYLMTALLPMGLEKAIYSAIINRKLGQYARRRGAPYARPSTGLG